MDILQIAEQNYALSYLIVFVVGTLQGSILARGIRNRFPKLKQHARIVSSVLLAVFSLSAIVNVIKFASPEKISLNELTTPSSVDEFFLLLVNVLGVNAGISAAVATFITV